MVTTLHLELQEFKVNQHMDIVNCYKKFKNLISLSTGILRGHVDIHKLKRINIFVKYCNYFPNLEEI